MALIVRDPPVPPSPVALYGSDSVSFLQAGTGAVSRTVQAKLRDTVSVKDFGATGDGTTDDTTSVQAALTYALQNNERLYFPRGIYLVTAGLTLNGVAASNYGKLVQLEGVGGQVDGTPGASIIKWGGSDSLTNTLFKANGEAKLICKGLAFYGASKVGKVFYATQNVGTSFSPFGWRFEDCTFEAAKSGGYGFYIDTNSSMARFSFHGCSFQAGAGSVGFYTSNANSVNHAFISCSFGPDTYGIHIAAGSFNAYACEFSQNSEADVYLQIHSPCSMTGCWTEQSKQFIKSDFRTQFSPLTLTGCTIASFPWSYWKVDEAGRTQPTNDFSQWIAILWDGNRGALNLIGCTFVDPHNGAVTGAVAPTTASTILVSATNGTDVGPPRFEFVGALSQNGTDSFTEQFFNLGTSSLAAPRIAPKKSVQSFGSLTGVFTVNPYQYQTAKWTLSGNNTITISVANQSAGDRVAFDVTQDGTGGKTITLTNAKTAGVFTPTAAAGARSRIEFEFDGTNWIEVARALNLA